MSIDRRRFWIIVGLLLALVAIVQISSMRLEVQTFDEGFHLAAGYSYLSQGDYRMNPEHPPLSKILAALPLLWWKPELRTKSEAWLHVDQWEFSDAFLFRNRVDPDTMLFAARLPSVGVTMLLVVAVAWWTRRRFGPLAGLLAAAFVALDPNLIAHGRYVTSDVIATLFIFLAVAHWCDYLEFNRSSTLLAAATTLGLALVSKFSAVILGPIFLVLYAIRAIQQRRIDARRPLAAGMALLIIPLIIIGLAYFRETGRVVSGKASMPSYWRGLMMVRDHNRMGHETYLLGQKGREGQWAYFPVAAAVKTPSAVLLLILAFTVWGVTDIARRKGTVTSMAFVWWAILLTAIVYFSWAMTSRINLGLRHILPVYPLVYVMLAAFAVRSARRSAVAVIALGLTAAESFACYPHYLAFFNTLSGGSDRGPEYLVDSNIDWGQDLKKLKVYLDRAGNPPLCIDYFGTADIAYYGIQQRYLPRHQKDGIERMNCLAAISVTLLKGLYVDPGWYKWLNEYTPIAKVGWSIYVYDFRKPQSSRTVSPGRMTRVLGSAP